MSSRYYQPQAESSRSSSSRTSPHHKSQPQSQPQYTKRTSTSSSKSSSSSSSSSDQQSGRYSTDSSSKPRVAVMRCSRCAKSVETIVSSRTGSDLRRVSTEDARASGMVKFGHNLYYCERCARLVGYT